MPCACRKPPVNGAPELAVGDRAGGQHEVEVAVAALLREPRNSTTLIPIST